MKAGELILALEDGKQIFIDYKFAFPNKYHKDESQDFIRTIEMSPSKTIHRYGWGSALGSETNELLNIIQHPEYYQIKP
jgi:hypothetical protein